jgi:uncharacterized protein YukE
MFNKKVISLTIIIFLIASPFVAFAHRLEIYDLYKLSGYSPPVEIAKLASDTSMVPSMQRLFYVYHPLLEDKSTFNMHCRSDEQTIVLGCFVDRGGIYLYNVTDSRLNGIEQVTAAHEALHAAYARLGKDEKARVDSMTSAAFVALTDQRVKDNIKLYRDKDPSVVPNELHSILGTEVRELPAELEQYYKKYFSSRTKILAYSEQYEKAFTERKNQVLSYDGQLATLKQQIDSLQAALTLRASDIEQRRNKLDSLKASNQIPAYNSAVPDFNAAINRYNSSIDKLGQNVDEYNDIVPKRNSIAVEESDLAKAIDSRSAVPSRQ